MVKLLKIKRRDFFQWDSIPILVSCTVKTRKFKLLYFRNETCFGAGNLDKDLFSIYLQPSVNTISQNLVLLTLQSDDVTLKTINRITHSRSVVLNSWPHLMAYRHIGIFRKTHLGWNAITGFSFADQLLQLLPDLPWYVNNYKLRSVLFVC